MDGQGESQEPDRVSVVVHAAKNLQSGKKGRCKFSVIFGVGSKKFRTDVVEDVFGSPVWNEEGEIGVDSASSVLTLTVTEKDDPLGQIQIPLHELPYHKPFQGKKVTLQPHKKCPDPTGELIMSAWVSATRPVGGKSSTSPGGGALKGLKKMKSKISHSPLLRRKSKGGSSDGLSPNLKGSMSVGDLAGVGRRKTNLLSVPSDSLCSVNSTDSDSSVKVMPDIRVDLKKPEVSGISPREGAVDGGTRLTLRGLNLGRSADDVVAVYVCGCNCRPTLEYESTSKIYVTTGKWKPGAGDIVVETKSGGKGSSMVKFTYIGAQAALDVSPKANKRMSPLLLRKKSPSASHKKRHSDTSMLSTGSIPEEEAAEDRRPEVSGISPKEGSLEGGTRLTVRGQNLGLSRDDVTAVTVCGKDCSDTMEYESPRKLYVTTLPWRACSGDIVVVTRSGGKGSSTVQFTYRAPVVLPPAPSPAAIRRAISDVDVTADRLSTDRLDADKLLELGAPSPAFSADEDDDDEVDLSITKPEVTGVSPREGPAEGGTRLTIRGLNLGKSKEDIVGLSICDANCLPMLEYESPMKLYCRTPPWKAGSGHIVVETRQGGRGSSLVTFTFTREAAVPSKPPRKASVRASPPRGSPEPAPAIEVQPATPRDTDRSSRTLDLADEEFGGATPYPDEPAGRGVDSAPTSTRGQSRSGGGESRPQPLGQEIRASPPREGQKRTAPPPPASHQKPPIYPGQTRQLPTTPTAGDNTRDSDFYNNKDSSPDNNKDKYISESQPPVRETPQSGPTRQELMEEIRRVKLDNKDLREKNVLMKQYLENLLSHVMGRCPEVLCIDHGENPV